MSSIFIGTSGKTGNVDIYRLIITGNYEDNNEEDSAHEFARIFGTEHPWFWRVHLTALVSLGEFRRIFCRLHIFMINFLQYFRLMRSFQRHSIKCKIIKGPFALNLDIFVVMNGMYGN